MTLPPTNCYSTDFFVGIKVLKTHSNAFWFIYFATTLFHFIVSFFVSFWVTVTPLEVDYQDQFFPQGTERCLHMLSPFSLTLPPDPEPTSSVISQNEAPFCAPKQRTSQNTLSSHTVHWDKNQTTSQPKVCVRMKSVDKYRFQIWKSARYGGKVRAWLSSLCYFSGTGIGNSLDPRRSRQITV